MECCWRVVFTADDDATSMTSDGESRPDAERCHVTYGDVIDKAARKNISICRRAGQDGGLSRVYVSQSNLLHIVFTADASAQQQQQHNFIIHVEGRRFKPNKLECVVSDQLGGCKLFRSTTGILDWDVCPSEQCAMLSGMWLNVRIYLLNQA